MRGIGLVIALGLSVLAPLGCSPTKYVAVCSEHGGVRTTTVPDHLDDYATRDVLCKDGVTQRPVQVHNADGADQLLVPSER